MFQITEKKLLEFAANAKSVPELVRAINEQLETFEINIAFRPHHFLAQAAHESMGFQKFTENLNYSSDRLLQVFPKYFRNTNPGAYHRQPEKIANRVYANRMGNGPEESGDGWDYRGRGIFQLTGKNNYRTMSEKIGLDLVGNPDLAADPENAVLIACHFWDINNLNRFADLDDILAVTKRINGGTHGLDDRKVWLRRAKMIFR